MVLRNEREEIRAIDPFSYLHDISHAQIMREEDLEESPRCGVHIGGRKRVHRGVARCGAILEAASV